ncbi:cytochrome oxidase putative small subunit CydP [Solimonas marina]|uniref:Uncharacterized protein n=1 Tax=Solimonas marina TaxID=2714601 RepID=A0A969WAL4_9GAMM|nr:cytochrome oxidase putative small subunit CydP [Solimonas marina]NKF22570.1 hypothetical protein [Solimonas marina]
MPPTSAIPRAAAGDRRLKREIVWVIVIKLIVLALLWQWFIHPQQVHVDTAGTAASIFGHDDSPSTSTQPSARHDQ